MEKYSGGYYTSLGDNGVACSLDQRDDKVPFYLPGASNFQVVDRFNPNSTVTFDLNGVQVTVADCKAYYVSAGVVFPDFRDNGFENLAGFTRMEDTTGARPTTPSKTACSSSSGAKLTNPYQH